MGEGIQDDDGESISLDIPSDILLLIGEFFVPAKNKYSMQKIAKKVAISRRLKVDIVVIVLFSENINFLTTESECCNSIVNIDSAVVAARISHQLCSYREFFANAIRIQAPTKKKILSFFWSIRC
jgi:hypothetical protein